MCTWLSELPFLTPVGTLLEKHKHCKHVKEHMNDLTGALLAPRSTVQEVSGYSCPLLEPRCRRPVDITESCSSPKLLRRSTAIMSRRVLPRMLTRGMSLFATIAEFRDMRFVPLILLVSTFVYQVAESHRVIFFRPSASATTVSFSGNVFCDFIQ